MTGFTSPMLQRFNALTQLLYCVMSALFGLYQATRSYVRYLRWLARFDLATICLALAFVFSGTIGAVAQTDTTPPGVRQWEFDQVKRTHDGVTPFKLAIVFTEPVFKKDEDGGGVIDGCGLSFGTINPRGAKKPEITDFKQDPENPLRYTITVRPVNTATYVPFLNSKSCVDAAGNLNVTSSWVQIHYAANVAPIANAGLDQTVASGETVTLDGRGSMDDGSINSYYWIDAVDDNPSTPEDFKFASQRRGAIVTFTAPTVAPGAANVTLRYAVEVTDEAGAKSDSTLSDAIVAITITPPSSNVRPVANAGTDQTVASGATVTLEGSGTDNGGTIQGYYWVQSSTGTAPALSAYNVAGPTLTAPTLALGDSDVTFSYALRVKDDAGAVSDDDEVTITVKANLLPIANAGPDQTVVSGATVELDGSGSRDRDGDRSIAVYTWFTADGNTPELKPNNKVAKPTLTAPTVNVGDPPVKFSYGLRVEDPDGGVSDSDIVEITVTAPDTTAPTGAFEAAQTTHDGMTPITITANFSEPVTGFVASDILTPIDLPVGFPADTYGPTITNFAVDPNDETQYTFTLTPRAPITINLRVVESMDDNGYTDKSGNVGKSLFRQFRFSGSNWPPVVSTGNDRSVVGGTPVTLEGSGKDIDGTVASYAWARTGGTQGAMAPLTNANMAMASFTANTLEAGAADETHEFTLTVTDDDGATSTKTVTITVTAPFVTTVAEAGDDQSVASGAMVELVGSDSTVDRRRTATYAWARTGGTTGGTATLTNANMKTASFTADTLVDSDSDVIHIFTLTVTDDLNVISTDTVTVKVLAPDSSDTTPPMAVFQNHPLTHDGTTAFTIEVKFTEPVANFGLDNVFGSLDGNPSNADVIGVVRSAFTPDPNDSTLYTITLKPRAEINFRVLISSDITDPITDASGNPLGQVTQVLIRYAAPVAPPVANAGGDQIVFSGQTVMLNGSASDKDDLIKSWLWERTGGTGANISISNHKAQQASFVADTLTAGASDVTHIIRLTVTDTAGNTDTDSATITVKEPFATPVANAGPDQLEVVSGAPVQLDGSGSSVDRRRTATYSWARTGGTTGGTVTFSPSATVESPTFPADTLTESDSDVTHIFTLTVTDGEGGMATDMVTVIVKAPVPDTTGPKATTFRALGLAQNNHDGMTPINFEVVFDEPIGEESNGESTFTAEDINRAPWNVPADEDAATHTATISKFMKDPTNPLRYTFTLTPGVDSSGSGSELAFTVSIPQDKITDAIGNKNLNIRGPHLTYSAPSTNIRPVADAGDNQTVDPGVLVTLDGSGSMDPDGLPDETLTYFWERKSGTASDMVTLSDPSAQMPTFTADNVAPGTVNLYHVFTLTVTDAGALTHEDEVRVTVKSPFLTLTAEAGDPQTVVSGATVTLDGGDSIVDERIGIALYSWSRTGGTGGAVTLSPTASRESRTFTADTLAVGAANVTHIFTLIVTDNEDRTATDTVTITVTAPFPDLVANAGPDQPIRQPAGLSGATVTLDGSGSTDVGTSGGRTVTYAWTQISGPTVTLSDPAAERPTFTAETLAPGATAVTYAFLLTVTDNKNSTAANDEVIITVTAPPFPALVANAGSDKSVVSEGTVTLDGSGTATGSGRNVTYLWTRPSGTGGSLTGETTLTPSFTAPALNPGDADAIHTFTLTVSDDVVGSTAATDTVTVTVTAPMLPALTANAGSDKSVVSEGTVTLDGSGTATGSGRNVTYLWTRPSGTGGSLTGETTLTPSFTAPALNPGDADAIHTFTLTVSDDVVGSTAATDTVTVTVTAPMFPALTANAGLDKSVVSEGTVTLDGSGTATGSGRNVTYLWTRPSGTGGSLTGETTLTPSFTAPALNPGDADAIHTFTLTVSDDVVGSTAATDTVTVTVTSPFADTVAEAGPDKTVSSGGTVTLDGSGSTSDRRFPIGEYAWTRTSGTGGSLNDADMEMARFTAPALTAGAPDETHIFTLTVTDSDGDSDTDTVTITVTTGLVADAGVSQTVDSGATVQLEGTGTATDSSRTVTYAWTRATGTAGGTGSLVTLSNMAILRPTFQAPTLNPGDADATYIFTLTVTDNQGSTAATDMVTITVTAPMFPALTANAGSDKSVVSEGTVTLDGSGTETGSGRNVTYLWTQTSGTGGTLTSETTLTPSFTAPALNPGDADAIHIFTLTVSDDVVGSTAATDTVRVTVTAPEFPALTAEAGPNKSVVSEMTVTLDGSGTETGSGRNVTYLWTQTSGTGGTLTGETTLTPSFTAPALNPGDADAIHIFTLTVSDDVVGSTAATDTVRVTVTAPEFPALTAEAGPNKSVVSEMTVTLDGSGTETGSGRNVTYLWTQTSGTGGTLTSETTLTPSFTAPALNPGDADAIHIFTLTVSDDVVGSTPATDTVMVTVTAPMFPALTAEAGPPKSVVSEMTVTLDGSGTETGSGRNVTYLWTQTSGTGGTLTRETTLTPSFTAPALNPGDAAVTYVFTLTVSDNQNTPDATDTVTVTVTAPAANVAPVADAGPNQRLVTGGLVTLDGSRSMDPDGTTVNYAWARSDSPDHGNGGTVTLSDPAAAKPTFTALTPDAGAADATYGFTLTVTDAGGATHKDTVTITVNAPPLANAGRDRMVASTATVVTLDGSGSSDSTGQFRYAWMRSLAPNRGNAGTVILTGEDEEMPTFTPVSLDPGAPDAIYGFTLTVTDNDGVTAVAMVKITLTSGLIANAGADKSVASEGTVTLDGSGSSQTDSTRTVTYLWTQTGGTGGTLADADKATARFTAPALNPGDADAIHTFTLTVSDDVVGSTAATDTVTVTVTAPMFPALTANAGSDKSVVSEGTVTLDGSGTATGSGRNVTYLWTRPSGTGGSLTGETTLTPSFKAPALNPGDADAIHTFTLTVTDNQGSTQATDTVEITVTAPEFDALVANAGADKSVASEATVTLDGSGSSQTDSSRTVTYLWTQTGGTGGTLADADKATARFTAPALNPGAADATHTFTLTVTDSDGVTAVDTVTITVTPPFAALVAQAGDPQTVGSGATVTLDGSGSTGSDINRTVTYAWERTGGTVGATAPLTSANTLEPTFKADTLAPGANAVTHIFTLTVTDNAGSTEATDTVTITVNVRSVVRIVNPAGPDGTIQAAPGAVVTLVGSVDPDVDVESYLWRRTGGTGDPNVVLNGADTATLMFTADTADTAQASFVANTPEPDVPGVNHSFTLTVKDKGGVRHTSDRVTVRVSSVAQVDVDIRVLRPIGGYLETRATALLNTQPDLTRFLEQDGTIPGGSGDFTFRATNGRVALDGGFVRDGVWGQVTGSYASSDSGDVKSVLGSFGFHRKYSERFLAGAMLQFDLADHDLARQAGMIDGTGWLVGPYFAARNGKRPLYFEGRLLYGQSDNDIRFIDTGTGIGVRNGSFDTKRLLAQLRVQGEIALSDENGGPRLIPYADVRWVEDRAATFTTVSATGLRNSVPGQKVSVGQLELGSNVEVPIAMSHGAMTFTGGLGLVYSNTEGDFIPSVSRSRGRGEIGLSYGLDDNVQIDFESFYDGIGTSEYEGYGLSLRAEMKF